MESQVIEDAYLQCQQICKNASTTFYSSFSALGLEKRRAVHAVYALCRWVDDIADGDEEPTVEISDELIHQTGQRDAILRELHSGREPSNPEEVHNQRLMALVSIRNKLHLAKEGKITTKDKPVFIALQDVFTKFPIRLQDFETIIEGMEDDLFPVMCNTWDELRSYCYKVASAVGLILIEIYGYEDRAARLHAIDLGIQMQLINVLRDVSEDYERGRIYLPKEVLAAHNIDAADLSNPNLPQNPSWASFMREYLEVVKRHQTSAIHLFEYLDSRSRVQPRIMLDAYTKIFNEIVRRSGDVFSAPLKLSITSKVSLWMRINYLKIKAKMSTEQ
ncbi:MAG: phytoene/squalene synthase family protein [Candidatus Poseidoniaceae archaeon]|nr:phytoene/squalene synthase family protein [Candidatus Poseidoniaceae archaeon]|tara:strand:- start:1154 stop:2152 length:999 start_codon:yes stop_codon:yes gene_type:complete